MANNVVNKPKNPVLTSQNKLKLATFSFNCSGGATMSKQPESITPTWAEQVAIAKAAEAAGIEAIIPVGRWKGMGGETNFQHSNFETLSWAAGLAAITEKVAVFSTVHVPTIHPVRLAKMCATIDHISNGRFGLNVVAGWSDAEMGMFAPKQLPHDERYAVADEWMSFTRKLWTQKGEFDWDGKYYKAPAAYSEPKPIQDGGPVIMNAGHSKAGMEFASKHADISFIIAPSIEQAEKSARDIKNTAFNSTGKDIKVFGSANIICRETEAEAREYYERIVGPEGDHECAKNVIKTLNPNSDSIDWASIIPAVIAGWGTYPLIGTPKQVAELLIAFSDAGIDGLTLNWVDYVNGIKQFDEHIMPYLRKAGVRY